MSIYDKLKEQGVDSKVAKYAEQVALDIMEYQEGRTLYELVEDLRYKVGLLPPELPAMVTHSIAVLDDASFTYLGENGKYLLTKDALEVIK